MAGQRMFVRAGLVVCAGSVGMAGSIACAGVLRSSGQTPLFGRAMAFQEWDVRVDPVGAGVSSTTAPECDARSMVFHDGALYVGSTATLGAAGPTRYVPGATGNLSAPSSPNFGFTFPTDRPRSGLNTRRLAINTSGAGYGAFANGEAPTLVAVSVASQEPLNPGDAYYTIRPTTPNATVSTPILGSPGFNFRPSAFAYARSTDRFVTAVASLVPGGWEDQGPSITQSHIRFHTHTGSGIDFATASSSFVVDANPSLYIRGLAPVSGVFASSLLSTSVSDPEVLLTLARYEDGRTNSNELRVYSFSGALLGSSIIGLSALNDSSGFESKPSSLAVDEASGLIFVGEQVQGRVFTFAVPSPSAGVLLGGAGLMALRRRRRPN